jgi:nucleotide-binding universal stress UspA family protein
MEVTMFKKILVPLDGSELAERALPPAQAIAEGGGKLILLHVPAIPPVVTATLYPHDVPMSNISLQQVTAEGMNYLALKRAELQTRDIPVRTEVIPGDPAAVILDTAEVEEVDLIVMSTHGYTGLDQFIMGSVTQRVLRHAPCPVLVVRKHQSFERILITLDGSELAELALEPGVALAEAFDAEAKLLRVKEPRSQPTAELVSQLEGIESGFGEHMLEDYYGNIDNYLVKQKLHYADQRPLGTLISHGAPAETIVDAVQEEGIDLLVIATHGRTGLRRWVYGSVAEKVLQRVNCAVLLIRPLQG